MKKKGLLITFICSQILMIFLYIHKESMYIKYTYEVQKLEKCKKDLILEKQNINQKIQLNQNKKEIKKFAQNNLGMKKIKFNQIKTIYNDNDRA